jgi:hypothetical protein
MLFKGLKFKCSPMQECVHILIHDMESFAAQL